MTRVLKAITIALLLTPLLLLAAVQVRAQQVAWTKEDAYQEVSDDAARCEAYYVAAWKCSGIDGNKALASNLEKVRERAMALQYLTGKSAGMSDAAILATFDLAMQEALAATDKSCRNLAVLIAKDASFCKSLLENPKAAVDAAEHHH